MIARVVGFDLDLTLVDTRARILAAATAAFRDVGEPVPTEAIVPHLGIPLADKVANLRPQADVELFVRAYRDHYHRPTAPRPRRCPEPGMRSTRSAVAVTGPWR